MQDKKNNKEKNFLNELLSTTQMLERLSLPMSKEFLAMQKMQNMMSISPSVNSIAKLQKTLERAIGTGNSFSQTRELLSRHSATLGIDPFKIKTQNEMFFKLTKRLSKFWSPDLLKFDSIGSSFDQIALRDSFKELDYSKIALNKLFPASAMRIASQRLGSIFAEELTHISQLSKNSWKTSFPDFQSLSEKYQKELSQVLDMPEAQELFTASYIMEEETSSYPVSIEKRVNAIGTFGRKFIEFWGSLEKLGRNNPIILFVILSIISHFSEVLISNIQNLWQQTSNRREQIILAQALLDCQSLDTSHRNMYRIREVHRDTYFTLVSGEVVKIPRGAILLQIGQSGKHIIATTLVNNKLQDGRCLKKYTRKIDISLGLTDEEYSD